MTPLPRIALLVDADNVGEDDIRFALDAAMREGAVTIRRAFGRLASIKGREKALTAMGFAAEVALPGAKAKDTADLLLAQYAIRIAERRAVDIVALVSSDSDFATIAQGVAESGLVTICFGRGASPEALRAAATRFVPFPEAAAAAAEAEARGAARDDLAEAAAVIRASLGADGTARMNTIGTALSRALGKDYKTQLGVATLSALVKKLKDDFELRDVKGTDGAVAAKLVADRRRR